MSDLAMWLVGAVVWAFATMVLLSLRRWLSYYLIGAFGFVMLVAFGAAVSGIDFTIESIEARQVMALAGGLGLGVKAVNGSGLAIPNSTGWALFDIGLECSAILEMAAIIGITAFYPAFSGGRKLAYAGIGVFVTHVVNLLRILLIVWIVAEFGTSWVFAAHAVFGRIFFFAATVALYWALVTRPTIGVARARVAEGAA